MKDDTIQQWNVTTDPLNRRGLCTWTNHPAALIFKYWPGTNWDAGDVKLRPQSRRHRVFSQPSTSWKLLEEDLKYGLWLPQRFISLKSVEVKVHLTRKSFGFFDSGTRHHRDLDASLTRPSLLLMSRLGSLELTAQTVCIMYTCTCSGSLISSVSWYQRLIKPITIDARTLNKYGV